MNNKITFYINGNEVVSFKGGQIDVPQGQDLKCFYPSGAIQYFFSLDGVMIPPDDEFIVPPQYYATKFLFINSYAPPMKWLSSLFFEDFPIGRNLNFNFQGSERKYDFYDTDYSYAPQFQGNDNIAPLTLEIENKTGYIVYLLGDGGVETPIFRGLNIIGGDKAFTNPLGFSQIYFKSKPIQNQLLLFDAVDVDGSISNTFELLINGKPYNFKDFVSPSPLLYNLDDASQVKVKLKIAPADFTSYKLYSGENDAPETSTELFQFTAQNQEFIINKALLLSHFNSSSNSYSMNLRVVSFE